MPNDFTHLHLHTEYSLLDGLTKTSKLFRRLKELDMNSCAITDHGSMYGAVEFYKNAKKEGIKPIIGVEAYTTTIDHKKRGERLKSQNHHLLLLAKDEEGYKNLMKLTSIAHLEGYYYRPRFTRTLLEKYHKGIICTSACVAGEIAQNIIDNNYDEAKKVATWFADIFGEDYYLEVQRHEYEKYIPQAINQEIRDELTKMHNMENIVNTGVIKLSRELGIPLVATNDAHYLNKEDYIAQDVLLCVSTGKKVSETKRLRMVDASTFYVTTKEEMTNLFSDLPDALENTVKAAEKCNLEIPFLGQGKWFFPVFDLPENKKPDDYLRELAHQRLLEKVAVVDADTTKRLDYELDIIIQKGYAAYFLIMMDLANWSNSQGIVTNTRGSVAGSLVSYVLGITTVNPLTYYLPFERFLNPFRPSAPDIDFDVADDRREDILHYMREKYGETKVAQVCTFGRMLARAAARDVARTLGYDYQIGDRIAKLIPPPKQGFPINIDKALATNPDLKKLYDSDADSKKILDLARQLEGSARHLSVHAAGVVISPTDITDFTPIQREAKEDRVITQYEMHACEDVGLVKIDILGIRNLSILGLAIDMAQKKYDIKIDLHKIPLDDTKTFDMISRGETMGTFQLGGSGMTRYIKELKPNKVQDLMAMVALYRPGPMAVIPEYIARKNNPSLIKYLDPRMEKFLKASYGLLVYQDDLLFCALDLAGYTWEEADKFRKAVGKKIPEEMAAQKEKFVTGIITNGQTSDFAEHLWKLFEPFQSYGFNKAHAASYGMISYYTAYMKANYPLEYMCALLTSESGDTEKISEAVNECRRIGIKVLTPEINESEIGFTIVKHKDSLNGEAIRFGLSAIKNVGKAAIEAIMEKRSEGKFISFADFLSRVDGRRVNKKVLESLIKVGALSNFGTRSSLLDMMDELRTKIKPKDASGQQGLFAVEEADTQAQEAQNIQGLTHLPEMSDDEIQSLERQLLGFSLSAKPISDLLGELANFATHTVKEILETEDHPELIKIAAVVTEIRTVITKKSAQKMAFVKVEDGTSTLNLVIFPRLYAETQHIWIDYNPVLLTGKMDNSKDDVPSLLVDEVLTKEDLKNQDSTLFIKIPKTANSEILKRLKELLTSNQGTQKVQLNFEGTEKTLLLPFGVSWSASLSHEINSILNPHSN